MRVSSWGFLCVALLALGLSSSARAEEPEEEEYVEPDAWERPPVEEEKAPVKAAAPPPEEPEGDGRQFEVGLLLGYAFNTDKNLAVDPYGLGFGLRLGYELDFKLFLGAGFEYFLGSSETRAQAAGGVGLGTDEASANYMFAHVEAGYDFWCTADLIVRPSLWLGLGWVTIDPDPVANAKATRTDFFLAPGTSVLYVTDGLFIGGDVRWFVVTGDGTPGLSFFANGGLRF